MESSKGRGSLTSRYLAALLAPAVVAGVMQVTWPFLQYETDLPYLLAVIFCAWYGGLGPGLLSLVISFLLTDFFFTAPYSSFSFSKQVDLVRLPLFAVTGSFICVMSELMHRERRRAGINVDALRESEERYRDLVENSRELICTHDLDGLILSANRAATEALGHDREDYFGKKNLREILRPEAIEGFEDYRARIRNDGVASGIMLVQTSSGEHRVWEYYNTLRTEGVAAPIVRGMARDITERKRNEERLQEYEKVVEGLEEMIAVVDRDYRYLIANRAFLSYRRMKREDVLGHSVGEILSEELFEKVVKEKLEECFRGKVVEYELRYDYPKLGKRDLIISYFPIEGPAGIDRVAVVLRDITERKRAEEALRQSEERFSKAFHSSPAALSVTLLEDGRLLEVNDAFLRMTGYQRNEVIGKSTLELGLWFDSNQRINMAGLLRERGTVTDLEFKFRKKSGEVGNGLLSVEVMELNGKPCVLGIAQDITERKLAEEALRTAKEFSETLIETANVIIVGLDNSGNINIFNQAAEEITGYTLAQLRGKNWFETLTPKDRFPHVWEEFNRLVAGGIPRLFENPILTKAGEERYILWRNNQVKVHGKIAATISFGNDITERIEAEKALRWAEQKYREIFENAIEGIFQISPGGGYISANPALARMLGFSSPDELIRERSDPAKHRYIDPRRREEYLRLLTEEGFVRDFEYEDYRKDGSRIWLSDNVHAVHDNEGKLLYYEGTTQDISERKRVERAQRESQLQYETLVQSIDGIVWEADPKTFTFTFVSKQAERILGYPLEQWFEGPDFWPDHMHPDDRDWAVAFCVDFTERRVDHQFEYRMIAADGHVVWLSDIVTVHAMDDQSVLLRGLMVDITERKLAEEKLRQSETQLAEAQHLAHVGSFEWDLRSNAVTWSDELYRIFGLQPEEINVAADAMSFIHPEDRDLVLSTVKRSVENKESYSLYYRVLRPDGDQRILHTRGLIVSDEQGEPIRVFGASQDVTERNRAEEALREAEQKYRDIFENAGEGIFQTTPDGRFIAANPALARMHGFASPAELIHSRQDISRQVYVNPILREEFKRRLEEQDVVSGFEHQVFRKDGSKIWISVNARAVRNGQGEIQYYEGTAQDITDRKQAEEALRESEERYRELFENAKDVIYVHDLSGRYTSVNRAAEKLTGYTMAEILGKEFTHFISPEQVKRIREYICRKLGDEGETAYESEVITKDGRRVAVEVNSHLILENGVPVGVQGTARDITERKAAEEKLKATSEQLRALSARLQSAREEEGTRIAREIHDELGSALTSLKWDLEEMDRILSTSIKQSELAALREKLHGPMKLADTAIVAVRRIASELRPSVLDDLGLLTAIAWQAQQFQARTGIVCYCDCSLEKVELSEEQSTAVFRILLEALTNVLRHAQATRVDLRINKESSYFTLSISDNGKGITESEKSEQQSLGILGMGERAHLIGGEIDIKGIEGKGTVVSLRVPISGQARVFKKAL